MQNKHFSELSALLSVKVHYRRFYCTFTRFRLFHLLRNNKEKSSHARNLTLLLPDYGVQRYENIFLYLPSTYYVRVLVVYLPLMLP